MYQIPGEIYQNQVCGLKSQEIEINFDFKEFSGIKTNFEKTTLYGPLTSTHTHRIITGPQTTQWM